MKTHRTRRWTWTRPDDHRGDDRHQNLRHMAWPGGVQLDTRLGLTGLILTIPSSAFSRMIQARTRWRVTTKRIITFHSYPETRGHRSNRNFQCRRDGPRIRPSCPLKLLTAPGDGNDHTWQQCLQPGICDSTHLEDSILASMGIFRCILACGMANCFRGSTCPRGFTPSYTMYSQKYYSARPSTTQRPKRGEWSCHEK